MFQLVHTQPPAICQTDQLRKSSYQSVAAAAGAPGELISAVTLCPLGSPDVRVAAFPATAVFCCVQEKSLSLSFLRFFFPDCNNKTTSELFSCQSRKLEALSVIVSKKM